MNPFFTHACRTMHRALAGASSTILISILLTPYAHALIDFNNNGVSDLWEIHYNTGELFANFDPTADPDGDGWSNEVEAVSGTDPFDGNPPSGCVRPAITHIPAVYTTGVNGDFETVTAETVRISWPTIPGKHYILSASPDLSPQSWITINDEPIGKRLEITEFIQLTQPDGSRPDKLFFRVQIEDRDSDGDNLSDAEERELGTNTHSASPGLDIITSTYDVYYTGTDPDDYDSSDVDGPDPANPVYIDNGPVPASTYAPTFKWKSYSKSLYYGTQSYTTGGQTTITGDLFTHADWDSSLNTSSTLSALIPPGNLSGMLPVFPAGNPPDTGNFPGKFGYRNDSNVSPLGLGTVSLQQVQARLTSSASVATPVTKHLMIVRRNGTGGANEPITITSVLFTIPTTQTASGTQVFGTEFVPAGSATVITDCYTPQFEPGYLVDGQGWDTTGLELWQSVGVGEIVPSRVAENWNDFNGDITSRLEIVIADGRGSTAISLSDVNWNANGCNFKINGLLPTPESGAQIILRLKSDPTVIFDTMRVHVFEKRTIPVTIFRVWDSRKSHSWVRSRLTNPMIGAALKKTFSRQANVNFKVTRVTPVDMAKNHNNLPWPFRDVAPQYFNDDGNFDNREIGVTSPGFDAVWDYTHSLLSSPAIPGGPLVPTAKYTIHIVNGFQVNNMGGATFGFNGIPEQTTFIPGNAVENTAAHEAGHALGLATRDAGPEGKHDLGNWPAHWNTNLADSSQNRVGLMHTHALPTMVSWIRREDWWKANNQAEKLK